ncbi:MAG: hypothetical protein P9M03_07145 [Candidatus Theseobacter exili]|nr:hypothetical protein [Candidatus Theseobacter exili]
MKEESSPEEKLLNLIKNGEKKPKQKIKPIDAEEPASHIVSVPESKTVLIKPKSGTSSFRYFNFLLQILVVIAIALIVYQFFFSQYLSNPMEHPLTSAKISATDYSLSESSMRPLKEYTKLLKKKVIFKSIGKTSTPKSKRHEVERGPGIRELTKGFNLSGILISDKPQAIIQDKTSGKVYYVRSGGRIINMKVTEVTENSVTISYEGDDILLNL